MKKAEKAKLEKAKAAARKKVEEEKKRQAEQSSSRAGITKPGIIDAIVEIIKKSGPIGKTRIHKQLAKKFPDREPAKMMKTLNCQIGGKKRPTRLESSRSIELEISDKGLYSYVCEVTKNGKPIKPVVKKPVKPKKKSKKAKGKKKK